MEHIDLQEFGRLQAQVQTLIASDAENKKLLRDMADNLTTIRLEMAEARGGWKVLMLLGGASATLGGGIVWLLSHFSKGSP